MIALERSHHRRGPVCESEERKRIQGSSQGLSLNPNPGHIKRFTPEPNSGEMLDLGKLKAFFGLLDE